VLGLEFIDAVVVLIVRTVVVMDFLTAILRHAANVVPYPHLSSADFVVEVFVQPVVDAIAELFI